MPFHSDLTDAELQTKMICTLSKLQTWDGEYGDSLNNMYWALENGDEPFAVALCVSRLVIFAMRKLNSGE